MCSKNGYNTCSTLCGCGGRCTRAEAPSMWRNSQDFEFNVVPLQEGEQLTAVNSPLDSLKLFFNEKITNLVFENFNVTRDPQNHVTYDSSLRYFMVHLCMLEEPKSPISLYWKDGEVNLFGGSKIISAICARDKWKEINSRISPAAHCSKLLEALGENVRAHYRASNYVAVDEWVPSYKGKNPFGVYMPSKPNSWGFKIYVGADSRGIPLYFRLYEGKSSKTMYQIVLEVEEKLPEGRNSVIVVDSYFGSEKLAQELNRRGGMFIMAIKSNSSLSKHSKAMAEQDIAKGEWLECLIPAQHKEGEEVHNENLLAIFFRDRKDLFLVTNYCEPSETEQKHRMVSTVVHFYNQFMGGVDDFDAGNWGKTQKFQDFSRCLTYWVFRAALNIAWGYWSLSSKESITQREFISLIILDFLKENEIVVTNKHRLGSMGKSLKCCYCKSSSTSLKCLECNVPLHWRCITHYHADEAMKKKLKKGKLFELVV